jgi:hypothetical protein
VPVLLQCAAVLQIVSSEFERFEAWKTWRIRIDGRSRCELNASRWPSLFQHLTHYIPSTASLLPQDKTRFRQTIEVLMMRGRAELPDAILDKGKRLFRLIFAQLLPLPKQSFRQARTCIVILFRHSRMRASGIQLCVFTTK